MEPQFHFATSIAWLDSVLGSYIATQEKIATKGSKLYLHNKAQIFYMIHLHSFGIKYTYSMKPKGNNS